MRLLTLTANHKSVQQYYANLRQLSLLHATHEGAVRGAFQTLLQQCAQKFGWTVVAEYPIQRPKRQPLRVDGAIVDEWKLIHGYWEAKDQHDDLREEAKRKIASGYPTDNILFQSPERAILYQHGRQVLDESIKEAKNLVEVLKEFFRYTPPAYDQWEQAVEEFRTRVPELARALVEKIEEEQKINSLFVRAFTSFADLCRRAINPNLADQAIEEMLVQHILTERIFRKVFDNPDFIQRNVIAVEIEKVVKALTARSFSREKFLAGLDRFYGAIETTAGTIDSFNDKQGFLNTVYEKFFQGFSTKVADTHGIVYTPQPIVRFMVRSVDEILQREFGRSVGSKCVHILDPFVGTGNFILNVIQQIPRSGLAHKYDHELHANEIMLLPYYIAAMNIEHEYAQLMGTYKPFEGLCLVDTFELAEQGQAPLFTEENTARVERQRRSPIFVIIGNPPYNAWQVHENDNNKNRKYPVIDRRVTETYATDSDARLRSSLQDPYVKAIRWASDRICDEGIVAFVTNNSFVDGLAFDGMRKHLAEDFDTIYVLDLGGNVRKNPKLSGTIHNVFGIQVGVSVSFFIRKRQQATQGARSATIYYSRVDEWWRKEEKLKHLDSVGNIAAVNWARVTPTARYEWVNSDTSAAYDSFVAIAPARSASAQSPSIFESCTHGVKTQRDSVVYDYNDRRLADKVKAFCQAYTAELLRYSAAGKPADVDGFLSASFIKWSRNLKREFVRGSKLSFRASHIRDAMYRPFSRRRLYFAPIIIDEEGQNRRFFPEEKSNACICVTDVGSEKPFMCLMVDKVPDLHLVGAGAGAQSFPLHTYDDKSGQRDNVTDWALSHFVGHYHDHKITKPDIFYYVYGVLHHPDYRKRFEVNLRRALPRIPLAPEFWSFVRAGKRLAEMHMNYDQQPEYALIREENADAAFSLRVEKMRFSKDRSAIVYNEFLILRDVPPAVFDYRLGSRSAIEWIVDQYQVSRDERTGVATDPNLLDDEDYILRLIGQVITVSIETVQIVRGLPPILVGEGVNAAGEAPEQPRTPSKGSPAKKGARRR